MKLTFLGGADEVGASCTLVEIAGKRLLIDAGIRISPRSSRGIQNSQLPDLQPISAAGGPDYILVTHAHTDHTGALPLVVEQYPQVPVLMTRPSEALVRTLQADAQRIMESRQEQEGELPLFDQVAVDALMDAIQLVEFDQPIKLGDDLQVTYSVSGHIAGAAMLVLESSEGTLVMSGDVSLSPQRTVESLKVPRIRADALVLESTYGGRLHANREAEEKRLIETLKRVTERGGRVLIPAFALGRAQEVIQIIHAYRDQINAPVYVDGMVRSVCDSYARFTDLLPKQTVRAAGDDHLFFRGKVKPVRSTEERSRIAMSHEPLIVVASSGMLTGGASVVYAKEFAADELSAILLTGYQDEEAPGRFLQRMMKERSEGDTPTLKVGGTEVKVRCELDTYSLSAHADEQELVNVALALKAKEVMLVHGDHGARHSLASALRRRQIITTTPKIGTEREFAFQGRPWALSRSAPKSGSNSGNVQVAQLWESLKDRAGDYFSTRELAQAWWGDGERAAEMQAALGNPDNIYFSADWRNKTTFRIQSPEQVARAQRQRTIMLANADIVGKLVVLRNVNDQPRLGIVRNADIDSFEADVQNARGSKHPADALLWVIGPWEGYPAAEGGARAQLAALYKDSRALVESVLPFAKRQELAQTGQAVKPEDLLPDPLPEPLTRQLALTTIVMALALDGATLEQDGLKPQTAQAAGPFEQNEARTLALNSFPAEARLRKVGMEVNNRQLILTFDFPHHARQHYGEQIEKLAATTGWEVVLRDTINQQALHAAVRELLPAGASISKGPSYYLDRAEIELRVEGLDKAERDELTAAYEALTGFRLLLGDGAASTAGDSNSATSTAQPAGKDTEQMEINAAYAVIRQALTDLGLYKTSLKNGQIILSFISPQVGERHMDQIAELAQKTGYAISIHPHPNQQAILLTAREIIEALGWQIRKGPGIHVDRTAVSVTLSETTPEVLREQADQMMQEQTGYTLEIES